MRRCQKRPEVSRRAGARRCDAGATMTTADLLAQTTCTRGIARRKNMMSFGNAQLKWGLAGKKGHTKAVRQLGEIRLLWAAGWRNTCMRWQTRELAAARGHTLSIRVGVQGDGKLLVSSVQLDLKERSLAGKQQTMRTTKTCACQQQKLSRWEG
jgi:hypothetical protein